MTAQPLGSTMTAAQTATPVERVGALCRSAWGLETRLSPLPSERDEIFRVEAADGRRFTLKLTSPAEPSTATDFQTAALRHATTRAPDLPIPQLVPDRDGRIAFRPDWPGDAVPTARLLTWLDGVPLASAPRSMAQAMSMGQALASLGAALADFDHPGAEHDLAWDLRNVGRLRPLLASIADADRRALVEAAMDRFEGSTAPRLETLRRQVVHNDLNPHNTLVATADPHLLTGIIDFGDLVRTALVADVAIAACYLIGSGAEAMRLPHALVSAYDRVRPLEDDELMLIAPLMEARHLMTVAITEWRAARHPHNRTYITKNTATAWHGLAALVTRPMDGWAADFLAIPRQGMN
jgi:Ser/Thr protein kinase RdoA (MazF antagonist)